MSGLSKSDLAEIAFDYAHQLAGGDSTGEVASYNELRDRALLLRNIGGRGRPDMQLGEELAREQNATHLLPNVGRMAR